MKTISNKQFQLKKKAHVVRVMKGEIAYLKKELAVADEINTPSSLIYCKKEKMRMLERYLELLTFSNYNDWEANTGSNQDFVVR